MEIFDESENEVIIQFIGKSIAPTRDSFYRFLSGKTIGIYAIYSAESEAIWNEFKRELDKNFGGSAENPRRIQIWSEKTDFNSLNAMFTAMGHAHTNPNIAKCKKIINTTGASKTGMFGILLYYALCPENQESANIYMLDMAGTTKMLAPSVIFGISDEYKKMKKRVVGQRGGIDTLNMRILRELYNSPNREVSLVDLAKRLGRDKGKKPLDKPLLHHYISKLYEDKLIEKRIEKRNLILRLNEFAYEMMKLKEENAKTSDS